MKRYLLGVMDSEEQQRMEERLICDRDFFELVMIAEDELIDEYLDDSLVEFEKERFVTHFLATTQQRQKLQRAQAIRMFIDRTQFPAPATYDKFPAPATYDKKSTVPWHSLLAAAAV